MLFTARRRLSRPFCVAFVSLLVASSCLAAGSTAQAATSASAYDLAFDSLAAALANGPSGQISPEFQRHLTKESAEARKKADDGNLCDAVKRMKHVQNDIAKRMMDNDDGSTDTQHVKITAAEAALLTADVAAVRAALLAYPGTASCGGATSTPSAGNQPATTVQESDSSHLKVHMALPVP